MISMKKSVFLSAKCIVLIAAVLIMGYQTCAAQSEHEEIGGIEFVSSYVSSSKFQKNDKDLEGEVEVVSGMAGISLMNFEISYKYDSYTWDNLKGIPFGNGKDDPWESLHTIEFGYNHSDMLDQRWGYFFGFSASSEFEKEMSGSYGSMGYSGVICNMPEWNLMIRVGGGVTYNEVETSGIPMIGIDWNSQTPSGFTVSVGIPETQIAYRFNPRNTIVLGLTGEGGMFRLADDSTVEAEGYLEPESYGAMLAYVSEPIEHCQVTLGGAIYFDRTYKIYDKNGNNEKEYDLDDAAGGFVSIGFTF